MVTRIAAAERKTRGNRRVRTESGHDSENVARQNPSKSTEDRDRVYREDGAGEDEDITDEDENEDDNIHLSSMKPEEALEYIRENYSNPQSSICYSSLSGLRKLFPSLTTEQIQNVLTKFESWSLMKSSKNPKKYNPFLSQHIRDVWQMDTVNLSEFSKQNAGVCHLLCCIDVFSKMLWVRPLFTCSAKEVKEALYSIMTSIEVLPEAIVSDR